MTSFSEQSKDQQGHHNHWVLGNLLPQGKNDLCNSTDSSPVRNRENSNSSHTHPVIEIQKASPLQKPINLLPQVPIQTSRKLSDREQRDCDVIGTNKEGFYFFTVLYFIYLYKCLIFQRD